MVKAMIKNLLILLATIFSTVCFADAKFTPLERGKGVTTFLNSHYRCNYWSLIRYYETQITSSYCGVASSVMVLNALKIEKPADSRFGGYPLFTQDTFFTEAVEKVVPKEAVRRGGMNLKQLTEALRTYPISVTPYYASETTPAFFREVLKSTSKSQDHFIIVNFYRPSLGQKGSGHFSPVGAYNDEEDTVLILDVSRYKYPPFWVKVDDLWKSMLEIDRSSKLSRGFILIST